MNSSMHKVWVVLAVLLIGVVGCASTQTQPSTGQYIDDASITTKVKSEMAVNTAVSAHHISVKTTKGVVHLTGFARSQQESTKAETIARNVAGVAAVKNDIHVK